MLARVLDRLHFGVAVLLMVLVVPLPVVAEEMGETVTPNTNVVAETIIAPTTTDVAQDDIDVEAVVVSEVSTTSIVATTTVESQTSSLSETMSTTTTTTTTNGEEDGVTSSALADLSGTLAALFSAKESEPFPLAEVQPVYALDMPIRIVVTPVQAIVQPEVSKPSPDVGIIETIVDTVGDWFFGGETTIETGEASTTEPSAPATEGELLPALPDAEIIETPAPYTSWLRLFVAYAAEDTVASVEVVPIATTTEAAVTVSEISTSTDSVQMLATATTTDVTVLPLVRLGTTSVAATLEVSVAGDYEVVIPPGGLPLGIHELEIATTTERGEIRERVVVDIGGGAFRQLSVTTGGDIVITTNEEGESALWLWQTNNEIVSVTRLASYGTFLPTSPLAVFDDTLFYLAYDGKSLVGYDFIAGTMFSETLDDARLATKIPLRSGAYFVTPNEIDFQFVSVVDTVY